MQLQELEEVRSKSQMGQVCRTWAMMEKDIRPAKENGHTSMFAARLYIRGVCHTHRRNKELYVSPSSPARAQERIQQVKDMEELQTGLHDKYERALARSQVPVSFAPAIAVSTTLTLILSRSSLYKYNRESVRVRACVWLCVCVRAIRTCSQISAFHKKLGRGGGREL